MNVDEFEGGREKALRMGWGKWNDTGLASLCVFLRYLYPGNDHWRVDLSSWFRPSRASHFLLLAQEKVTKEKGTPFIRPRLRRGSLVPSPLQGHATKGHPWPIVALATSMSLNPFHGDSIRPPEGDLGVVCTIAVEEQRQGTDAANFNFAKFMQARDPVPFRRPSVGVA